MDATQNDTDKSNKLQNELAEKKAELEKLKIQHHEAAEKANSASHQLLELEQARLQLVDERGKLLTQLDERALAFQNNEVLNDKLHQEIALLKEKQFNLEHMIENSTANEDFKEIKIELEQLKAQRRDKENEIEELLRQKRNLENYRNQIDSELKTKSEELTKLYHGLEVTRKQGIKKAVR